MLRTPRFEARTRLELLEGVAAAVARLLNPGTEAELTHDTLFRNAYPVKRKGPRYALIQDDGAE